MCINVRDFRNVHYVVGIVVEEFFSGIIGVEFLAWDIGKGILGSAFR